MVPLLLDLAWSSVFAAMLVRRETRAFGVIGILGLMIAHLATEIGKC